MTDQYDFIRIESIFFGSVNIRLSKLNLTWPPPEFLVMTDGEDATIREATANDDRDLILHRVQMSELTEEQIEKCPGIARGALYKPVLGDLLCRYPRSFW